jgi:hypothetical protein
MSGSMIIQPVAAVGSWAMSRACASAASALPVAPGAVLTRGRPIDPGCARAPECALWRERGGADGETVGV